MKITKTLLVYSMMIISSISLINIVILYWIPRQLPGSSFSVVSLMMMAFITKAYWLIPISFLFCFLMFLAVRSFPEQKIVFPVFTFVYLSIDLILVVYVFLDTLNNNVYFTFLRLMQILVNLAILTFLGIYFHLCWQHRRNI